MSASKRMRSYDDDCSTEDDTDSVDSSTESRSQRDGARVDKAALVSNIADEPPKVGMRLEIRDKEYIWSAAYVTRVKKDKKSGDAVVTVRCDGWGTAWDEEVPWPSERLARLYTYTKKVRCLVDLLPKKSRSHIKSTIRLNMSNLWPCSVQFRMPHPFQEGNSDGEQCALAEEHLRLEVNIFVQPYGVQHLPKHISSSLDADGGRWLKNSRLRLWKDNPFVQHAFLHDHFGNAFEEARNDKDVPGLLFQKALVKGSLLDDTFRVRVINPENSRGVLVASSSELVNRKLPKVHRLADEEERIVEHEKQDVQKHAPPPDFPPPVQITDPLLPGVVRGERTKKWVASVSVGGNDVFLGSYSSQKDAWNATQIATNNGSDYEPANLEKSHLADLRAVPLAAIIDASHHSPCKFSLHNWAVQHILHRTHARECDDNSSESGKGTAPDTFEAQCDPPSSLSNKKRKLFRPRRVDLKNCRYIT